MTDVEYDKAQLVLLFTYPDGSTDIVSQSSINRNTTKDPTENSNGAGIHKEPLEMETLGDTSKLMDKKMKDN